MLRFITIAFSIILIFFTGCEKSGTNGDTNINFISLSIHWAAMTGSETRTVRAVAFDGSRQVSAVFDWQSSDNSVATVTNGLISPVGVGTASIRASSGGVISEPCTVHIADEWILYSGNDGLRIITPENRRDMKIPGTYPAMGPMIWSANGILYAAPAPFTYKILYFRPFDEESTKYGYADTLEPIYDLRAKPGGGYLMTKYLSHKIYAIPATGVMEGVIEDNIFLSLPNVDLREFDISPSGGEMLMDASTPLGPRFFRMSIAGAPLDTLLLSNVKCPRYKPPLGEEVAFSYNFRVWLTDLSGSTMREMFHEGSNILGLSWSPDGARLAMCVSNPLGDYELWIGTIATGMTTKLDSAQVADEYYLPQWVH